MLWMNIYKWIWKMTQEPKSPEWRVEERASDKHRESSKAVCEGPYKSQEGQLAFISARREIISGHCSGRDWVSLTS